MVEGFRSGKAGYDSEFWSASNTVPEGVYYQGVGGMAQPDAYIDPVGHSTEVAGIMVGNDSAGAAYRGVAPRAQLHSIGVDIDDDSLTAVAAQRMALLNTVPEIVAINMSFGGPQQLFGEDGRSLLTQFIDWSARRHDVLYVTAWTPWDRPYTRGTPEDNFNGITVAASALDVATGTTYQDFSSFNVVPDFTPGERTYIDLLAPGEGVQVLDLGNVARVRSSPSYAAPHVAGAVALLHEDYAHEALRDDGFNLYNFQHTLAKAILLNSADKLGGVHGSNRDVRNHLNQTWTETTAHASPDVPLDAGIGAGHLNVNQAIRQLSAGRYASYVSSPVNPIPRRGWADHLIFPASVHEYVFTHDVEGWVAVTVCWDREVEHTGGQTYHYGDQFFPYDESYSRLNDLDVYLVRASDNFIVSSSVSYEHTEEHIFADVPFGRYKIVVDHVGASLNTQQRYSIAWWADSPYIAGDYDEDNQIDNGDYLVWRSQLAAKVPAGTSADGNNDRFVDAADYVIWRKNSTAGSGSVAAVPEPRSLMLLVALGACRMLRRTNRLACHGLFGAWPPLVR